MKEDRLGGKKYNCLFPNGMTVNRENPKECRLVALAKPQHTRPYTGIDLCFCPLAVNKLLLLIRKIDFYKDVQVTQWREEESFQHTALKQLERYIYTYVEKNETSPPPTFRQFTKICLKWIINLNVKPKTTKRLNKIIV